jgi:hypothetical protein
MWGAHWTIHLEKQGIPSVFIVDDPFRADVEITCEKEGMSLLRRVMVPHPCGDVPDERMPEIISQIINQLTTPLTPDEVSPKAKKIKQPSRIAFEGSLEEVNRFFYQRGWTDGLPIIPPTEEMVAAMLKGTSHAPDEIVTMEMMPESLTVTVEKVAIVGAMTGCEPEYMPVLLGMVETFAGDLFSSMVRSTSSFSFATVVNGPITKKIKMNSGMNALGSGTGNKANATIGRFLRMAIICLGGGKTGLSDMSSQGNVSKYSFAFAENEEKSPWEPYHVSLGYKNDESVVSILAGGWNHNSPFGGNQQLDHIAKTIAIYELPNGVLILMDPMVARKIANEGFTKKQAEDYIWKNATKTVADFKADPFYPPFIEPALKGRPWHGEKYYWPGHYLDLPDDELVPVFPRDKVRIVVVGGETNPFTQAWQMGRSSSVAIDKWK